MIEMRKFPLVSWFLYSLAQYRGLLALGSLLSILFPRLVLAQSEPYIQAVSVPVAGGEQVSVYGRGFCGISICSGVTLKFEKLILSADVKVDSEGKFYYVFPRGSGFDNHIIIASQSTGDGSTLQAKTEIMIGIAGDPSGTSQNKTVNPPAVQESSDNQADMLTYPVPPLNKPAGDSIYPTSIFKQSTFWIGSFLIAVVILVGFGRYKDKKFRIFK